MSFNGVPPKVADNKPAVFQSLLHATGGGKAATSRVTDFADALRGAKSTYAGTDNKPNEGLSRLLNGGSGIPPTGRRV